MTADETREQLIAAAMHVFSERGYDGTRISEIAKQAGMTAGAIYNHFDSKADLLTAALSQRGASLVDQLLESDENLSVLDAFRVVGAVLARNAKKFSPLLMEAVVAARRDPDVKKVVSGGVADHERHRADLIRRAQATGEVDPDLDADAVARYTTLLVLGSLVVGALELEPVDPKSFGVVMDRVLDAARPPKETR